MNIYSVFLYLFLYFYLIIETDILFKIKCIKIVICTLDMNLLKKKKKENIV